MIFAWFVAALHPERHLTVTVLTTPHSDALSAALRIGPEDEFTYFSLFNAPGHAVEKRLLADNAALLRGSVSFVTRSELHPASCHMGRGGDRLY